MGVNYIAVQWNRQKKLYDAVLVGGVAAYLIIFSVLTKVMFPRVTDEIMLIRAFGSGAFVLLHVILCIGPLCRMNAKFLPLLYNRRHAGVTCFLLGLIHAALVIITYHAGSDTNPILSIFVSSPLNGSVAGVPFQPFGFFALVILFLMAATSHDFWLANLSAPVWKTLHMLVYAAYALLVLHVTFGVLQGEASPVYVGAMSVGLVTVLGLHLSAARKERPADETLDGSSNSALRVPRSALEPDGFIDACAVADIPENRARIVCLSGERVAIFKYDGKISAVSNVCQHQNGPLGEGKILDGCITCPWHGYQYLPDTGASPPPFVEKVPTFNVSVKNGRVLVHPKPNPAGTRAEPAVIDDGRSRREEALTKTGQNNWRPVTSSPAKMNDEFYIGWESKAAPGIGRSVRRAVVAVLALAVAVPVVLALAQRMIGESVFEWGTHKNFTGILRTEPYPHLLVPRPGNLRGAADYSTYYLVAPWKFGLNRDAIAAFDGRPVKLKGTLIYRGNQTMVEMHPAWIEADKSFSAPGTVPVTMPLGKQTLVGEIVDSKCFLGVMNPGQLTPHRACAIRCISGGVPPVLLVRQKDAPPLYFLLVSAEGRPVNQQVLKLVAEPVEITGEVERQGEMLILRSDPATYRRMHR